MRFISNILRYFKHDKIDINFLVPREHAFVGYEQKSIYYLFKGLNIATKCLRNFYKLLLIIFEIYGVLST